MQESCSVKRYAAVNLPHIMQEYMFVVVLQSSSEYAWVMEMSREGSFATEIEARRLSWLFSLEVYTDDLLLLSKKQMLLALLPLPSHCALTMKKPKWNRSPKLTKAASQLEGVLPLTQVTYKCKTETTVDLENADSLQSSPSTSFCRAKHAK